MSVHTLVGMDEARRVIERLERIEALDRSTASPAQLLDEVRGLLRDAEAWVRVEGGDAADEAVIRLREALSRDAVPA
jgi:hypothetical protein